MRDAPCAQTPYCANGSVQAAFFFRALGAGGGGGVGSSPFRIASSSATENFRGFEEADDDAFLAGFGAGGVSATAGAGGVSAAMVGTFGVAAAGAAAVGAAAGAAGLASGAGGPTGFTIGCTGSVMIAGAVCAAMGSCWIGAGGAAWPRRAARR